MDKKHKNLAYPFLYDSPLNYKCDFEIFTDEISSAIGLLRAKVKDENIKAELSIINELMYHINASLRTFTSVTNSELNWLEERTKAYSDDVHDRCTKFVTPQGGEAACISHIIRSKCKGLVRLLHRHETLGNEVDPLLFNFANVFSGYFFVLALKLNKMEDIDETEFCSRNYK
ncbi:MAG: ATP--cob(I)alamin adenosyltransferase [Clostridium sp.]